MTDDTTVTDSAETVPQQDNPEPKKAKKKNQNKKKPAPKSQKKQPESYQNTSDSVSENLPTVPEAPVFVLPVVPDEWLILPEELDAQGGVLSEERFVFFKDDIEIISVPFTEANFAGMYAALNNRFGDDDYIPDHWTVKEPLNGDSDPVMSLSRNGKVLAATSLDQIALKKMVNALQRHIIKPPTLAKGLTTWWLGHKVLRVFASFLMLPIFIAIIFAGVWAFQH